MNLRQQPSATAGNYGIADNSSCRGAACRALLGGFKTCPYRWLLRQHIASTCKVADLPAEKLINFMPAADTFHVEKTDISGFELAVSRRLLM